jgi:hypothetical protein
LITSKESAERANGDDESDRSGLVGGMGGGIGLTLEKA